MKGQSYDKIQKMISILSKLAYFFANNPQNGIHKPINLDINQYKSQDIIIKLSIQKAELIMGNSQGNCCTRLFKPLKIPDDRYIPTEPRRQNKAQYITTNNINNQTIPTLQNNNPIPSPQKKNMPTTNNQVTPAEKKPNQPQQNNLLLPQPSAPQPQKKTATTMTNNKTVPKESPMKNNQNKKEQKPEIINNKPEFVPPAPQVIKQDSNPTNPSTQSKNSQQDEIPEGYRREMDGLNLKIRNGQEMTHSQLARQTGQIENKYFGDKYKKYLEAQN